MKKVAVIMGSDSDWPVVKGACQQLAAFGIHEAYLLTGHTSFYERCGWEFFCMVEEDGGNSARCYRKIHKKC